MNKKYTYIISACVIITAIVLHINFLMRERGCMTFGGEWFLYTIVCTAFAWRVLGDVDS